MDQTTGAIITPFMDPFQSENLPLLGTEQVKKTQPNTKNATPSKAEKGINTYLMVGKKRQATK